MADSLEVGFTGSRDYERHDLVENFVRVIARKYPEATVVSGGRGLVDSTAENTAVLCGLEVISYRPHDDGIKVSRWKPEERAWADTQVLGHANNFTKNALLRNFWIAGCERVVAFWNLKSRGTADTISKARGKGSELFVYGPDGRQLTTEEVTNQLKEVLG